MRQPLIWIYVAIISLRISDALISEKNDVILKEDSSTDSPIMRMKRVTSDPEDITFWANRGRRTNIDHPLMNQPKLLDDADDYVDRFPIMFISKLKRQELDGPFWGNRGKRVKDKEFMEDVTLNGCGNNRDRREQAEPFWGNRGRRNDEVVFWGNRGRRSDDFSPFWGNRGKKSDTGPFWGNRGKKSDGIFWGNRGRRDDLSEDYDYVDKKTMTDPFWGNRGKKESAEPFWGNRGKKSDKEYLDPKERKDINEPFWGARGKKFTKSDEFDAIVTKFADELALKLNPAHLKQHENETNNA